MGNPSKGLKVGLMINDLCKCSQNQAARQTEKLQISIANLKKKNSLEKPMQGNLLEQSHSKPPYFEKFVETLQML